ncbi:glycosyltransferase family 2 protein [Epilithonimonas sp.]|uniref:glycosyltransferase family 2 protein n=1 Tax=Epilithonimonas sp. TaxID=2894511 RepID=UPI0028977ADA|nr:glycosyltransferase family 2 protein [Epilithonimonas sp.]
MKITICTPTYNRAILLQKLYKSLLSQTKKNFEWIIIDDGSTDNTADVVESFDRSQFSIEYYQQENGGKHIALNYGLEKANGEYFFVVDSDDFLANETVEECLELINEVQDKSNIAGFTFIHFSPSHPINIQNYGKVKQIGTYFDYNWEFNGELIICFKTHIAKAFPFPVFMGEKFCRESLIGDRILDKYELLYTDKVLAFGDYQPDGLSANSWKRMLESPQYSMLYFKEKINNRKYSKIEKENFVIHYWKIAMSAKHISFFKKFFDLSFYWNMWFFLNRIKKKLKRD